MSNKRKSKTLARFIGFVIMLGLGAAVLAQMPTPQQLQRFEQLTPEQKARVMKAIE